MNEIFGFDVQSVIPRKMFQNGAFAKKPLQSICYDERNQKFVIGFSHKENNNGTLIRMDKPDFISGTVEKTSANIAVGHANDMAYHAGQHKIYVARGDKKIAVVNADTLTVEKFITIDMVAWQISLFPDGTFFVSDGGVSVRYDGDFKNPQIICDHMLQDLINVLHMPYDSVDKSYAGDWQGSFVMDGKPYMIYTEWNGITDAIDGNTGYKSCVLYCPEDHSIRRFPTYMETENACVAGTRLYVILGNEYIGTGICELACDEVYFKTARTVHKELEVGADMNMMFTPGLYRCKNAAKAKTIKNLPNIAGLTDAGFTLEVVNTGLNHMRQTIYSNNFWVCDAVVTRGYNCDNGFAEWYVYRMSEANKDRMYQTVFGKVEANVPDGDFNNGIGRNFTLDFKQFVPQGYGLYAANIDCECEGSYYTLPFVNDWGKCSLHIQRIIDNKITLRSLDKWGKCVFWITGFCKKI